MTRPNVSVFRYSTAHVQHTMIVSKDRQVFSQFSREMLNGFEPVIFIIPESGTLTH